MKINCSLCINDCKKEETCKKFQLQKMYVKNQYQDLLNIKNKLSLYNRFSNFINYYVRNGHSNVNTYIEVFYSLDQDKFIPIKPGSEIGNWIKVEMDMVRFKEAINSVFKLDDFIKEVFEDFFKKYSYTPPPPPKAKELF